MHSASKLTHLLNLLQMDIGSNAEALSDAKLIDLQNKLQSMAGKSSVRQKPKPPPPAAATAVSAAPPQTKEGAS